MTTQIKTIEDLSLNAWPSHQMQVYDGWIIRFSHFYTHRTNSVEELGLSTLPLDKKIDYCEEIYHRWKTPSIFKITPLSNPSLDGLLAKRGYKIEHATDVMTMDLDDIIIEGTHSIPVQTQDFISHKWIESLFRLKQTTNATHRKIVPSMYAAIPKDVIAAAIFVDDVQIATGLGILDRDYIGIYAIHVSDDFRQKGYAQAIVTTLLQKGKDAGASRAYLQVVSDNAPAKRLYRKIGFRKLYHYWFRVKKDTNPN